VESSAPDHVGGIHGAAILELRQSVLDTGDSGNALHAYRLQILGLYSDQRFAGRNPLGTGLLADGSLSCQHSVKDDPTDEGHEDASHNALGAEGDRTGAGSG
jgi:hypothetical protein